MEDGAQVVIMTHYGPYNSTRFPDDERDDFCAVLERHQEDGKKVVAWIYGHTHKSDFYEWDCPGRYDVDEIPIFNVGSPFYSKTSQDEDNDDREYYVNGHSVHFTLFRFTNNTLEALDVSELPGVDGQPEFQIPGISPLNFDDEDNPDGRYGGWVRVLDGHLSRP